MTSEARVVIIGGGIAGCSLALHLAERGAEGVVLVEKDVLTSGATAHAAGLVTVFSPSPTMMKIRELSLAKYRALHAEVGEASGWRGVGSLRIAGSPEQSAILKRKVSQARALGLEVEMISAERCCELFPYMSGEGIECGIHLPGDGFLEPAGMTTLLAKRAAAAGAELLTKTQVEDIELDDRGRVAAVLTNRGRIQTQIVVNACGIWGPRIAAMCGAVMPASPIKHQYVITKPVEGQRIAPDTPVLRDAENLIYVREEVGGLLVGGFETTPEAWHPDGVPWSHSQQALEPDWGQFESIMEGAITRIPMLEHAEAAHLVNHPDALTPDGEPLVGPYPGIPGLWALCGLSLNGFGASGGLGQLMAEWILDGRPSIDLHEMDVRRYGAVHANQEFVTARATEAYKYYYYPRYPNDEWEWGRPWRTSGVYEDTQALGAVFGQKNGWERTNYYRPGEETRRAGPDQRRGWRWEKPDCFEDVGREHRAVRERAGLFDLSSFGKLDVSGPGALDFLQRLACGNVDREVGRLVYTQYLNSTGGIETDLTIVRLSEDKFRCVCGSAFVYSDLGWMQMHAPTDGSVVIEDVTEDYSCLALWGPRSRDILAAVADDDVSNEAFPYLASRSLRVGGKEVWAQRVSYCGELGWELYVAAGEASALWKALMTAGADHGITPAGYRAIDSLRMEKAYRYWGSDITPETSPLEAGLGFCVSFKKDADFIGRDALLTQKETPTGRRLSTLTVEADPFGVHGGEAIYADGALVGRITSAAWGYTVEENIAMSYLPQELSVEGVALEVDLFGERTPAVVTADVLYDPTSAKLKI